MKINKSSPRSNPTSQHFHYNVNNNRHHSPIIYNDINSNNETNYKAPTLAPTATGVDSNNLPISSALSDFFQSNHQNSSPFDKDLIFPSNNTTSIPSSHLNNNSSSTTSTNNNNNSLQEREWGIFCLENKTDKPIVWGMKGLHIHWKKGHAPQIFKEPSVLYSNPTAAYYFYNQAYQQPPNFSTENNTTVNNEGKEEENFTENNYLNNHRHFYFTNSHTLSNTKHQKELSDLKNIIRYKLEPNSFCFGRFPFHHYSDYFILIVGLFENHHPSSIEMKEKNMNGISLNDGINNNSGNNGNIITSTSHNVLSNLGKYFYSLTGGSSSGNNSKQHNSSFVPRTQTSVGVFDYSSSSSSNTPTIVNGKAIVPKKKMDLHCKAYFIEHFHNKDIILSANVTKSLFLFSDYTTFTVEPITYRFFANYKPCEKEVNPPIKLTNNIYYDEIREIQKKKKKINESNTRNAIQFSGLNMYEDESINILRESILFYFLYLRKLNERINLLILMDEIFPYEINEFLMEVLIGGSKTIPHTENQRGELLRWFETCVKIYNTKQDDFIKKNSKYIIERNFDCGQHRSLNMYQFDDRPLLDIEEFLNDEDDDNKFKKIDTQIIDGIIVLSNVGNSLDDDLKRKLELLEGFPTLYILYGLEKCTNIYEAIKKKEIAEMEINSIYTNSKPYIIQYKSFDELKNEQLTNNSTASTANNNSTDTNEFISCQFFREVIDVSLERVTSLHKKSECSLALTSIMKLFNNSELKIELKDLQENEQRRNVWFFGLDNEKETISVAVNSLYQSKCCFIEPKQKGEKFQQLANVLICVRTREQFLNANDIILENSIQSWNQIVIVKRNFSDLFNHQWPVKRRKSGDGNSMKKSSSFGALSSLPSFLDRKRSNNTRSVSMDNRPKLFEMNKEKIGEDDESEDGDKREKKDEDSDDDSDEDETAIILMNNEDDDELENKDLNGDKNSSPNTLSDNENTAITTSIQQSNVNPSIPHLNGTQQIVEENNKKKKNTSSLNYPIQKGDIVVLCIELSGRILLTGENGIFTSFIKKLLTYTDKIVLFVERMDRNEFTEYSNDNQSFSNPSPETNLFHYLQNENVYIYGDEKDLLLDKELQQSQDLSSTKYRCYFSNNRPDTNNCIQQFWKTILHVEKK
ncbi:hypothetical protein ABK040_015650 [Willaertia magna]